MMIRAILFSVAGLHALSGASAQTEDRERVFREEALAHSTALSTAYRRLEDHILRRSTAATSWAGSTPPATTGWLASWTERGLRARYCNGVLLVYCEPARLKGVGADQRAVRVAPYAFLPRSQRGLTPPLHWLENGTVNGGVGRENIGLPACMSSTQAGGALPSGRVAFAGRVVDPQTVTRERVRFETRTDPCPANFHPSHTQPGETVGRAMIREVKQTLNGRGDEKGSPTYGTWTVLADNCRPDYTVPEHASRPCASGTEGKRLMVRDRKVTAAGNVYSPWRETSNTCWTSQAVVSIDPVDTYTSTIESRTVSCPAGWTGTQRETRTVRRRSRRFPWDTSPTVAVVGTTSWAVADNSNCRQQVVEVEEEDDESGPMGGPGGVEAGYDYDTGEDPPGTDDSDGEDDGGDDGGADDGCFLTTAIVHQRGIEPDDGPTLTALRRFRDSFMSSTPDRREMILEYYRLAPRIVAAIPAGHAEWGRIGDRVDAAVAAINAGEDDAAFRTYVDLVRDLIDRWLDQEGDWK